MTPSQKAIYEPVVSALGKMDVRLRNEMQRILRYKKSPEIRAAYGIPVGVKLSREQLLGYLIVGPRAKDEVFKPQELPRIQNYLKSTVDNFVHTKDTQINIFDMFSGVSTQNITDVWNKAGRADLNDAIEMAAKEVLENPAKFAEVVDGLRTFAINLSKNPDNLKVDSKDIIIPKKVKRGERLVSAYYFAESGRLISDTLDDVLRIQDMSFGRKLLDLSPGLRRAIATSDNLGQYVLLYIDEAVLNPQFKKQSLEDIAKAISDDNPEIMKYAPEFVGEVSDIAETIMRNNRIYSPEDLTEELETIIESAAKPGSTASENLDAFLGVNVSKQIKDALESGGGKKIQKALADELITNNDPGVARFYNKVVDSINNFWYTFTLTLAPRFHGANIVGTPEVIYTTTGRLISPLPIPGTSTFDAALVMKRANGPKGGMVAVIDPAGRRYTNNEIYQAIMEGGGETVNKAELASVSARKALAQIQGGSSGLTNRVIDFVLEIPNSEDAIYRMAVAIEALREGQPLEQAIQLARRALYDKGDISKAEEQVKRLIMFYSFMRNNFVNLLKNTTDARGWKRISNVAKTKRGLESIFLTDMTEEEKKYLPDTAATKVVIGKGNPYGARGTVIVSPQSSTFSALELLTKFLSSPAETAQEMIVPRTFAALEKQELDKIPPEHIFWLKGISEISGIDEVEFMSWLAGEKIVPLRSDDPGNIDGYIYPLLSESARSRYAITLGALNLIGINRLLRDIPESARAPGMKTEALTPLEGAGFALGAISSTKTLTAEQQRLSALLSQTKEGRALLKDIKDVLSKDAVLTTPPSKQEREIVEEVTEGKKEKIKGEKPLKEPVVQEALRLKREIDTLKAEIRQNPLKRDENVAEIMKKAERLKELQPILKSMGY